MKSNQVKNQRREKVRGVGAFIDPLILLKGGIYRVGRLWTGNLTKLKLI